MAMTIPCPGPSPVRPPARAFRPSTSAPARPSEASGSTDQQNVDLMPADGQYPDDEHPKYCNMTKAEGGGYVAHGCHVWSNRAIGTLPLIIS